MNASLTCNNRPICLRHTDLPSLIQAVKEQTVLHMQRNPAKVQPDRLYLVVSLQLIPDAYRSTYADLLASFIDWLSLQCHRIEVTGGRCREHRLYFGEVVDR